MALVCSVFQHLVDYLLKLLVFSILSEFYFQVPDSAHMELVQVCLHSTAAETFVSLTEPIWTNATNVFLL